MQPNPTNPPESSPHERVSPELLAWAQQTLDVEDFLREVRQIEETGGCPFESFIDQVEARVRES